MAFGKEMGMMGGKANLKGKGEGKPKEKSADHKDEKPQHEGGKHMHIHHDGLSMHAKTTDEQGNEQNHEPQNNEEAKALLDQHFSDGQAPQPEQAQQPMQGHSLAGF